MVKLLAWILLLFVYPAGAAIYVVSSSTGSDLNPGTTNSPWATIQKSANTVVAGDTVYVLAGTYNESVFFTNSGTAGNFINFVGPGVGAICRLFGLGYTSGGSSVGLNYVNIIGLEFTHPDLTTYIRCIYLAGRCTHIGIYDNYFHDYHADNGKSCVDCIAGSIVSYITVRGNYSYWANHAPASSPSVGGDNNSCFFSTDPPTSDHILAEYNHVQRSSDCFNLYGTNIICRNNWQNDFSTAYWSQITNDFDHPDGFQPGSDGISAGTRHHLYEANLVADRWDGNVGPPAYGTNANSHFGIWQDTVGAGDTNVLIRGNIGVAIGNGGIGDISTPHLCVYRHTFYNITNGPAAAWFTQGGPPSSTNPPTGPLAVSVLLHTLGANSSGSFYVQSGVTNAVLENNWGFNAPAHTSFVGTTDPLFVNLSAYNFHLQGGSPCIGAGTNIVSITSASGSGTTFSVNDPQLLIDGWGITDEGTGDTITIGSTTTTITSINWANSNVTVSASVTWTQNQPVHWGSTTNEDIGALPNGSSDLTGATITKSGATYTVKTTGSTRGVLFYKDGIPNTWVSNPPFVATFASGVITAKAYALYAQASPSVAAVAGTTLVIQGLTSQGLNFNQ